MRSSAAPASSPSSIVTAVQRRAPLACATAVNTWVPVFVLTHHEREPLTLSDTTFTFVTAGIESALEQARAVAGDKDVTVGGGAQAINESLEAGLVDELDLSVVPLLLGSGAKLFDGVGPELNLERFERSTRPA